ncbi:hypothetical protein K432DRAFT_85155 [Lepidopterella palustris CBS 459.81]|uniref:Uncharacterized protein n=1 Tax=Lepidopterella palustris CBS 459.81 TaxID=1314670 RepID=A0A8E2JE71_9PEZI|nr:hypothetical protein K432DRAFT_85155 [Lepidopterella palustris CBS 459.81]
MHSSRKWPHAPTLVSLTSLSTVEPNLEGDSWDNSPSRTHPDVTAAPHHQKDNAAIRLPIIFPPTSPSGILTLDLRKRRGSTISLLTVISISIKSYTSHAVFSHSALFSGTHHADSTFCSSQL